MIRVWLAMVACLLSVPAVWAADKDLAGMVVIIDPGHGGVDPGSHGQFNNGHEVTVVEDEYCYDVAVRLRKKVIESGGLVFMTIRDTKQGMQPDDRPPQKEIPHDRNEVFSLNGATVRAGNSGMARRTGYAIQIYRKYSRTHRVVFMSIHFDVVGSRRDLAGVHFIAPPNPHPIPTLVRLLETEFRKDNRLRIQTDTKTEYHTTTKSGQVRDLFILRSSRNNIRQRVLIELGNFNYPGDVWRIRSPGIRDSYVDCMARALEELNKEPRSSFLPPPPPPKPSKKVVSKKAKKRT